MTHVAIEVVELTIIAALAVAITVHRVTHHHQPDLVAEAKDSVVAGPQSIASTPPFDAVRPEVEYQYTVRAEGPGVDEAERALMSSTAPLIITRGERVGMIRRLMRVSDGGLAQLPDVTPEHVLEHLLAFRRDFFDWLTESDEELGAEWEDCVLGVGRWER